MVTEEILAGDREDDEQPMEGDEPETVVGRGTDVGRQFLETRIRDLKPQSAVTIAADQRPHLIGESIAGEPARG